MKETETTETAKLASHHGDKINKEAPQLVALLKEMKAGLDLLRNKVLALTDKVKADQYPTADGYSYLDAKYLLFLSYCQSLVYYLLRKAKGIAIEGHPVVQSLVEIRLFLEKVRPIDKKLQYQIQKLTRVTANVADVGSVGREADTAHETEDSLKYRPNPDMLISKTDVNSEVPDDVYRPPKFAPTTMKEDKSSKQERNALRKEKEFLRQSAKSAYVRELVNEYEDRPEEVSEFVGSESTELTKYRERMEEQARREEELFTRAPVTKSEKRKMKQLEKSRNGLDALADSFYDEIKSLPLGDSADMEPTTSTGGFGANKFKRRKRKH